MKTTAAKSTAFLDGSADDCCNIQLSSTTSMHEDETSTTVMPKLPPPAIDGNASRETVKSPMT
jgi:hypothetical protein